MLSNEFIKETQELLKKATNSCHQWYGMRVLDVYTKLTGGKYVKAKMERRKAH